MDINSKIKIMKTWILALAMMAGVTINAQHGERKHEGKKHDRGQIEHFTPEQRAELQTKKLTLELDLTDKQQADIKAYFTKKNKEHETMRSSMKAKRQAGEKLTSDERFAMQSKLMDEKIAAKAFFNKTLDAKQLAKFQAMKSERKEKITKKYENLKKRWRR